MRTAIRKPKINKPSKGMKNFLKQCRKVGTAIKSIIPKPKQWYHSGSYMRSQWLASHSRSCHTPHQGAQEKARRVRQLELRIILP